MKLRVAMLQNQLEKEKEQLKLGNVAIERENTKHAEAFAVLNASLYKRFATHQQHVSEAVEEAEAEKKRRDLQQPLLGHMLTAVKHLLDVNSNLETQTEADWNDQVDHSIKEYQDAEAATRKSYEQLVSAKKELEAAHASAREFGNNKSSSVAAEVSQHDLAITAAEKSVASLTAVHALTEKKCQAIRSELLTSVETLGDELVTHQRELAAED